LDIGIWLLEGNPIMKQFNVVFEGTISGGAMLGTSKKIWPNYLKPILRKSIDFLRRPRWF